MKAGYQNAIIEFPLDSGRGVDGTQIKASEQVIVHKEYDDPLNARRLQTSSVYRIKGGNRIADKHEFERSFKNESRVSFDKIQESLGTRGDEESGRGSIMTFKESQ